MATNWKQMLQSEGLKVEDLDSDSKAWVAEYEKIEKSKLPTIKKDGEFTPAAQAKLNRINKAICDGIADVMVDRDESDEAKKAAEEEARKKAEEEAAKNDPAPPKPVDEPVKSEGFFDWLFN